MLFLWSALVVYLATLFGVLFYALRYGDRDERGVAIALIAGVVASQFASFAGGRWRDGPEYWLLAVDALFLAALIALALRSRKFWPLWAAASQLVGTTTHITRFIQPTLAFEIYATSQPFWVFPILAALYLGTRKVKERRKLGI